MIALGTLLIGFVLDLIVGDPHGLWHPVQGIGWIITKTEKWLRKLLPENKKGELLAGGILVFIVLFMTGGIAFLLVYAASRVHIGLEVFVRSVMCWQILAMKSLKTESMKVYQALEHGSVEDARTAVSWIVGRDTRQLTEEGIIKAAVETVAENTSDGVIAPMFFLVVGGPVLGFLYKAVNTMDSMVGYKNEKYLYFGRVAAKLDDIVNYIPARISAVLMTVASWFGGYQAKAAWQIYKRDKQNHASPNSAQTEAVMAGALGLQLAGDTWYFGTLHKKPFIGDPVREAVRDDISHANRLLYFTGFLAMAVFCLIKIIVIIWRG